MPSRRETLAFADGEPQPGGHQQRDPAAQVRADIGQAGEQRTATRSAKPARARSRLRDPQGRADQQADEGVRQAVEPATVELGPADERGEGGRPREGVSSTKKMRTAIPIPAGTSRTSRRSSGANASVPNTVTSATNGTTVAYVRSGRCPAGEQCGRERGDRQTPPPKDLAGRCSGPDPERQGRDRAEPHDREIDGTRRSDRDVHTALREVALVEIERRRPRNDLDGPPAGRPRSRGDSPLPRGTCRSSPRCRLQ